jgi:hypothetical protein
MSVRPVTMTEIEQLGEQTQDLLVERTLWGLDPSEETELSVALGDIDATAYEFERTVGALCVGMFADEQEPLPADLRTRLGAIPVDAPSLRAVDDSGSDRATEPPASFPFRTVDDPPAPAGARPLQWMGWIAAAACLTYAIFATTPESGPVAGVGGNLVARVQEAADVIRADWAGISAIGAPDHALDQGVSGAVVWSDDLDQGFMRISGIEANDPTEFQYQLWIFDADRRTGDLPQFRAEGLPDLLTQRPVDGGVFDVTLSDEGELIVPIDAKLPVGEATIFAVTKEAPGGVVVSDRDIVFLALRG